MAECIKLEDAINEAMIQWGNDYFSAYYPNCGVLMERRKNNNDNDKLGKKRG